MLAYVSTKWLLFQNKTIEFINPTPCGGAGKKIPKNVNVLRFFVLDVTDALKTSMPWYRCLTVLVKKPVRFCVI